MHRMSTSSVAFSGLTVLGGNLIIFDRTQLKSDYRGNKKLHYDQTPQLRSGSAFCAYI